MLLGTLMLLSGCGDSEPEYVDISVQHAKVTEEGNHTSFTQEEYQTLADREEVHGASFYGRASSVSYYYQEGEDYVYNMAMLEGGEEDRITVLDDSQKVKSASLLKAEDLAAGALPQHAFETVIYSADESLIGQEFLIHFKKAADKGEGEEIVGFSMVISGIQTEEENQIFFSEDFCRQMGRRIMSSEVQSYGYVPKCNLYFAQVDGNNGIYSGAAYDFERISYLNKEELFFDDCLDKDEIILSDQFLKQYGPVMDTMELCYSGSNLSAESKYQEVRVKNALFPGNSYMKIVSREMYDSLYGTITSDTVMLRVERDEVKAFCRELTAEGYIGIVWE